MNPLAPIQNNTFLSSPMPAKVVKILAQDGDRVTAGQSVFVLESMKMLHELRMPKQGKVVGIQVQVGDLILPENHLADII